MDLAKALRLFRMTQRPPSSHASAGITTEGLRPASPASHQLKHFGSSQEQPAPKRHLETGSFLQSKSQVEVLYCSAGCTLTEVIEYSDQTNLACRLVTEDVKHHVVGIVHRLRIESAYITCGSGARCLQRRSFVPIGYADECLALIEVRQSLPHLLWSHIAGQRP